MRQLQKKQYRGRGILPRRYEEYSMFSVRAWKARPRWVVWARHPAVQGLSLSLAVWARHLAAHDWIA